MIKNRFKKGKVKMKFKKVGLLVGLVGIVLLSANGYCGLQYERELAQKFCPSLQLHSADQGVSPKPVEIMSNERADGITTYLDENDVWCRDFDGAGKPIGEVDISFLRPIATIQESEEIFRPNLLRIERDVSPNTVFYSESFGYEQSKEKNTKKGRIIGTIVGIGIGGGVGYLFYLCVPTGLGTGNGEDTIELIIAPAIIGGLIGYSIGNHYDKNRFEKGSRR